MPAKLKSDPHLEIAHVLFIDVVGYSKLVVNEQRALIEELTQIVRTTQQVLHDLGQVEVKHGAKLGIVNLYSSEFGNSQLPQKFAGETTNSDGKSARGTSDADAPEKSIAVLPFESLSADPNNTFFADAIQDEILTDLSKIADLKVISRASAMQYKTGVERNLCEIADDLGVAHIVEGSVQPAGNRVRVRAQLIDARSDRQRWAERYDG